MGFQLPEKTTKLNGLKKHLFSHKSATWAGLDKDGTSLPHLKSVGQLKILQEEGTSLAWSPVWCLGRGKPLGLGHWASSVTVWSHQVTPPPQYVSIRAARLLTCCLSALKVHVPRG